MIFHIANKNMPYNVYYMTSVAVEFFILLYMILFKVI
jgi:hypothetical protein